MKFVAKIEYSLSQAKEAKLMGDKNISSTEIEFDFVDLVNPDPLFDIREILIPWLRKGNIPEIIADKK